MTLEKKKHPTVRVEGDEYFCSYCGKRWDRNDPDPPSCERPDSNGHTRSDRIEIAARSLLQACSEDFGDPSAAITDGLVGAVFKSESYTSQITYELLQALKIALEPD
jgi:hypothetical protein